MPTVLCADDSPTIQKVVELTFADSGIRVVCVSDGEAAIRRFREVKPDLLLLDVAMPARNGYEVSEWVRREAVQPQPRVLLLSSALDPFDERRARGCGADGHMAKPFESGALLARVRAMLGLADPAPGVPADDEEFPAAGSAFDPNARLESLSPHAQPLPLRGDTAPARPAPSGAGLAHLPVAPSAAARAAASAVPPGRGANLSPAEIEAIARRVVELIGPEIIREIAWEILPDLADTILREKLERTGPGRDR